MLNKDPAIGFVRDLLCEVTRGNGGGRVWWCERTAEPAADSGRVAAASGQPDRAGARDSRPDGGVWDGQTRLHVDGELYAEERRSPEIGYADVSIPLRVRKQDPRRIHVEEIGWIGARC